jgi:hypothetical protein
MPRLETFSLLGLPLMLASLLLILMEIFGLPLMVLGVSSLTVAFLFIPKKTLYIKNLKKHI